MIAVHSDRNDQTTPAALPEDGQAPADWIEPDPEHTRREHPQPGRTGTMTREYVLWIATAAYGLHMIEETIYNWHDWVRRVLGLQAEWSEFYIVNAIVIVLGVSCAMVGWRKPAAALAFPAFMLVNAVLFHITPVIVTGTYSPGVFTAVALFLPIGTWAYWGAWRDGVLTKQAIVISGVLGFVTMLFPIVLQATKHLPFFSQAVAAS